MDNCLCLSEIEEHYILHSPLIGLERLPANIYCVLIKYYLIIFKKPTDVNSFLRIPLTTKTQLEESENRFTLIVNNYRFNFGCYEKTLFYSWIQKLEDQIKMNLNFEPMNDFEHAEVKMSRLSSQTVFILLKHDDYKIYVYESLDYHLCDILSCVINLKHYEIEYIRSAKLKLNGMNEKIKIIFKDEATAEKWKAIMFNNKKISIAEKKLDSLAEIYENESNKFCADCGKPNPDCVLPNFCIVICASCSNIHRSVNPTHVSIKASSIDQYAFKDYYLIKLLKQIGNNRSNSFWLVNQCYFGSVQDAGFIIDKYLNRMFADQQFDQLSNAEFNEQLKESLNKEDVFFMYRLWFSSDRRADLARELLTMAQDRHMLSHETFLSLQLRLYDQNSIQNAEAIFQISFNGDDSVWDSVIVTIVSNDISIKRCHDSASAIEDIAHIAMDNIAIIWYDIVCDKVVVAFDWPLDLIDGNGETICAFRIAFKHPSKWILAKFKTEIMHLLSCSHESNLFMNIRVLISPGDQESIKCKCCVTEQTIMFHGPLKGSFDLKLSNIRTDEPDQIVIDLDSTQLSLIVCGSDDRALLASYLAKCRIKRKCSIDRESSNVPVPIERMASFISLRGLLSEGIFRIGGSLKKVNSLYESIERDGINFNIDPNLYDVNDVSSCLKKYLRSFDEPLVPVKLFSQFQQASRCEDDDAKIELYQHAIDQLPTANVHILRQMLELCLLIRRAEVHNKMNSDNLALSTASSIVSFETFNMQDTTRIMRDLIENFTVLFNYCERTDNALLKCLIQKPPDTAKAVLSIRSFYVNPHFKSYLKMKNYQQQTLNFLSKDAVYLMVFFSVDDCRLVSNVCEKMVDIRQAQMWHFLVRPMRFGSCKTLKRPLYFNESAQSAIGRPKTMNQYDSFIVLLPTVDHPPLTDRRLFQCELRFKSDKYRDSILTMTSSNYLQISDKKGKHEQPTYEFVLSDLDVYRFHNNNINKIIVLHGLCGSLKFKFHESDDMKQFIFYYDKFRAQLILPD